MAQAIFLLLSQKIFCAITFILCFCIEIELTSMMVSRKSGIGSKKSFMKQENHGDIPAIPVCGDRDG